MRRFWFHFDQAAGALPPGVSYGIGVTAFNYDDALSVLRSAVFERPPPEPLRVVEDVDVGSLDDHVRPNMGDPTQRGVWFPLGYS